MRESVAANTIEFDLAAPRRGGLVACCLVTGAIFSAAAGLLRNPPAETPVLRPPVPVRAAPATTPFEFIAITIGRNDTLDQIFRQLQLQISDLAELRRLPDVRRSLDSLRPGDVIQLTHLDGELRSLSRRVNETALLTVTRAEQGFSANILAIPFRVEQERLQGTVNSSLYSAVNAAGGNDRLAIGLADVFKYDIDFVNAVQPGDRFTVAWERRVSDDGAIREGDILAAEFVNTGKAYRAVRYVTPDGRADYYTPDGRPVRKAFLRFPVDFARISSGFNLARRHPILNRVRAHRGIDFAAPTGTPVKAAGSGRVVSRGTSGGYGNVVVVAHGSGVTTLYGHLSRFARGVSVGDRVAQGEVIGYVGRSGLATGPHLHYEYRVNGVHQNPAKVTLPKADPIPERLMADFRSRTAPLLAELDAPQLAPVRVAAAAGQL